MVLSELGRNHWGNREKAQAEKERKFEPFRGCTRERERERSSLLDSRAGDESLRRNTPETVYREDKEGVKVRE